MNIRLVVVITLLVSAASIVTAPNAHTSGSATIVSTKTLLSHLVVAREHTAGYEPAELHLWADADHDGCDTGREVLIAEATATPHVGSRCTLSGGTWFSSYDGVTTTDPSTVRVDHLVPLAEAWQSGAWRWSADTRARYANDLGYGAVLIAVSARSSLAKGAREPQDWLPPRTSFDCTYMARWVAVKWRWRLAIGSAESTFLSKRLALCGWPSVREPSRPSISSVLCGLNERMNVRGQFSTQYQIRNTYYRGQRPMCIQNVGGLANFSVTQQPGYAPTGRVAAFPDIFRGCIWNRCSPNPGIPIKVSAVGHLVSTWHTTESAHGSWNAAYEMWFGKRRMTTGQADGAELMIWLNEHGTCCALQRGAPKVWIDGRRFWLSHWRACSHKWHVCFNYIQFRLVHRTWRADRLRLKPFISRCVRIGLIRPGWWMENVGAGFEIWSGGRGLATTRFGVSMSR